MCYFIEESSSGLLIALERNAHNLAHEVAFMVSMSIVLPEHAAMIHLHRPKCTNARLYLATTFASSTQTSSRRTPYLPDLPRT